MTEIRNKTTGEVISIQEYKLRNPDVQLPRAWTEETFNAIGYDPVYAVAPAGLPSSSTKEWYRDGVEQNSEGRWVYRWIERNIYNDIPGGATQAEQEAEHLAREQKALEQGARNMRDDCLRKSDWIVAKSLEQGVQIPEEWRAYRQALRDVTSQAGFPRNIVWPELPK